MYSILLGMLSLRCIHTFHPAIIQAKNFRHAPRINTSPGTCSLILLSELSMGAAYPDIVQASLRIYSWDGRSAGRIWERESDARRHWSCKKFSL